MIHGQAALSHHLLQVSIAKMVSAIPSDAEEDKRGLEVTPLERDLFCFMSIIPGG